MHFQDIHESIESLDGYCAYVHILVIISQRLAVQMDMYQTTLRKRPAVSRGQVFVGHQHMTYLRIQPHQCFAAIQNLPVLRIL